MVTKENSKLTNGQTDRQTDRQTSHVIGPTVDYNLIRKVKLISKMMTPQPGKQTIAIHKLSNVSKTNQKMKCGQYIEYNMHITWWRNYSQTLF